MFKKSLVVLALLGTLVGCQTTAPKGSVTEINSMACFYPDAPDTQAPKWVCGVTPEGLAISATGYAKKNAAGLSVMSDISLSDARVNLARQFEVKVQSIIKTATTAESTTSDISASDNVREYFEKITKSISSVTLKNSKIMTKKTSPAKGLYTLVGMDKATFDLNFNKIVQKASDKDGDLWAKFNDKKTADALSKVLAKLDK